jgi:glycogen operon protein
MQDIQPGQAYPLGATVMGRGVNFSLFSRNAQSVELLLFDQYEDSRPGRVIKLDPRINRTFYYWHVFVPNIGHSQLYGYRVCGPNNPANGLRFDCEKLLIDPYARSVAYGGNYDRQAARQPGDNIGRAIKSVVVDPRAYDWESDQTLDRPFKGSIIYEMHVGGFTAHPSSELAPQVRGTYAGVIEKIAYLQALGVTTVELLPVHQFDEQDAPHGLTNYWGYSPLNFFSPHRGYCTCSDPTGPVDEFKDMVKALHRAGIEVILDVVFNHTAEAGVDGPMLSFRGIENRAYYILDPRDRSRYMDYSGCGNTVKAYHSVVRRMIMDSLHYWVDEMHVDGFRFDLASVFARDENGVVLQSPPIIWEIESDPILAGTKIIAEAWDAAGLYQVGSFIGHRWAEWNGRYRDDVRRFISGQKNTALQLAARVSGSRDLYPQPDREPHRSVNFITCHDGFTLNDLVTYNKKHNLANNNNNTDGSDDNNSWNCGVEGPSTDPSIEAVRSRQIRNFFTVLFHSQGTPMMNMGDEVRRTQHGNNNVYCQNNALSWFDWNLIHKESGLLRFVCKLIEFYKSHELFLEEKFWTDPEGAEITWHGVKLRQPDWRDISHTLSYELLKPDNGEHLYIILNAFNEGLSFELPGLPPGQEWRRVIDTALNPPLDFADPPAVLLPGQNTYSARPYSSVVLKAYPAK